MYLDDPTQPSRDFHMPLLAAGTITFHKHEGSVELSGFVPRRPFFEPNVMDAVLARRKRKLVASTDIGNLTLYGCRVTWSSVSNNATRIPVSFSYAMLVESGHRNAEKDDELAMTFVIDTSKYKTLDSDHIDINRDIDPAVLRVAAENSKSLGSVRRGKEGYHLQTGWVGSARSRLIDIRRNLSIRRTWTWSGDAPIWMDVYDRVTAIRSALAVLLGHVPDHQPLVIQARVDGHALVVGKILICVGYADAQAVPDDADFLVDPHADGGRFIDVVADWSQRYMDDAQRFRAAVNWAEWSTIFRPTMQHALINTWMACSKLDLEVSEGKDGRRIDCPLNVELNRFDDVLVQAKWCRNYIEHGGPKDGSWNYDDPHVLRFLRDTVDFYFYAHVLGLCGWDVKKWQETPPSRHRMGRYVLNYEPNHEYAQQTKLKPR